jgi:hypothetical protein
MLYINSNDGTIFHFVHKKELDILQKLQHKRNLHFKFIPFEISKFVRHSPTRRHR